MTRNSLESGTLRSPCSAARYGKRELRTRGGFGAHGIMGRSMRRLAAGIVAGFALLICAAPAALGQSREDNGAVRASRVQPPTTQIIVKWRDGTASRSEERRVGKESGYRR